MINVLNSFTMAQDRLEVFNSQPVHTVGKTVDYNSMVVSELSTWLKKNICNCSHFCISMITELHTRMYCISSEMELYL